MEFSAWDAGQVRCRTGGMQDRRDAGKMGCRKGGNLDTRDTCRKGVIWDWRDSGLDEYRK